MKTSNKILIIAGLVVIGVMLIGVIGSRIFLNQYTETYGKSEVQYSIIKTECTELLS